MNKIIVLSSIVLSIFIISCNTERNAKIVERNTNDSEIIDLNNIASSTDSICLDDLIDSMYIIKLETNENSLLSNVGKVVFGNDYIYVLDRYNNGSVAIFDFEGHFIRRLVSGNGPGEINLAENLAFDYEHNELYVYQTGLVNKYTSEGIYIDNILIHYFIDDFCVKNDTFFCVESEVRNHFKQFTVLKTDTLFNILDDFVVDKQYLCFLSRLYLKTLPTGDILISRPLDDYIYLFKSDRMLPLYKLDFSSCKLDVDDIDIHDYESFHAALNKGDYYFVGTFFENSNYQIISFADGYYFNTIYRNKTTGKYRCGVHCKSSFSTILHFGLKNGVYNDFFVNILESSSIYNSDKSLYLTNPYLSSKDKAIIQNISLDDNPIIVLYKLKDMTSDIE